jgi:DNA-binding beta-propeller fold protein YncE
MDSLKGALRAVGLALLLGAALLSPSARAAQGAAPSHAFLFSLQGFLKEPGHMPVPPPEGEFEDACGVAVDSFGDTYISDYYHHVIYLYDPSHTYMTQIPDPDPDGPCNLAVDSEGRLFVNHWRRDVVRYTPSEYPPTASSTYGPAAVIDAPATAGARSTGLALDPSSGDLYVDDRTYVAVYEPSGEPVLKEGVPLRIASDPQASYYGVAVSDFLSTEGYVYVPDASDRTVKVFDPATSLTDPIQTIDGAGTPQRGFVSLADSNVAVNPADGHIYLADNLEPGFEHPAAAVDEFNPAGEYRGQLPKAIKDAEPTALALDGKGDVYVTSGNDEEALLFVFGATLEAHRLGVLKSGSGQGTITSEPSGINCGSACAAEYNTGEEVILTAVPDLGSAFVGWSGCDHPSAQRCTITIGADREVGAQFEEAAAALGAEAPLGERASPGPEALALTPSAASPGGLSRASAPVARQHHRKRHHRKGKGRR